MDFFLVFMVKTLLWEDSLTNIAVFKSSKNVFFPNNNSFGCGGAFLAAHRYLCVSLSYFKGKT